MSNSSAAPVSTHHDPSSGDGPVPPPAIAAARDRFSSLRDGFVYFDAPGGTQTPDEVGAAVADVYLRASGNLGAHYATGQRLEKLVDEARAASARFLGCTFDEVIFGANMTSLNFTLSRTLGRQLAPGDEIVVTRLDHDANVAPWLDLAADRQLRVLHADVRSDTSLDLSDLERHLSSRTKVVAFPWAANSTGTVVDARAICDLAHQAGALAWVDAVQYAAHEPMDARAIDADVVTCSSYKFCGPHLGIAFGRRDLLESWRPYKARPVSFEPVGHRFETGTLPFELLGGLLATYAYLDSLGGMAALAQWERQLGQRMLAGFPPGTRLYGLPTMEGRLPVFLINFADVPSARLSLELADLGFGVWNHGSYYALGLHERIGWGEALRIGLAHYNTLEEIDRFNEVLARLVAQAGTTGEPR
ncbi:MAG TPA: aminotransferase class V-fold PLP-dependent enzyme [Streptosporangiaceae bacterium]|nr:aminotransferase class V-fold PLP-dependent enzyme [Streptosporangiaceae bacterium]